jgi:hypothetical protein
VQTEIAWFARGWWIPAPLIALFAVAAIRDAGQRGKLVPKVTFRANALAFY